MLTELHARNLGIVDDVAIELGPGLTAITGETGAGKTLLIEALELLLGARADAGLVREGATEARVEGRFVLADGREVVLGRVVPIEGRSRAYFDGRLATAAELVELAAELVDLHGQHPHVSLLTPAVQRASLDQFAGAPALDPLRELRAARLELREVQRDLAALGGDEHERARELDLLGFQIAEIEQASISDSSEDVALEAEEVLLADATAHRDALAELYRILEGPASDALGTAIATLAGRAPFTALEHRLRSLHAELADVEHEARVVREGIPEDEDRLELVRARRQLLRELRRKYGDTLGEILEFSERARVRQLELEGYSERASALEAAGQEASGRASAAAIALTSARRAAAAPLAAAVVVHLRELAMPAATFDVLVEPGEPGEDGADTVTFLLAPNPGEPPRPVARAASGGELSRAMLALRLVLTDAPPTVVFDEIDAGIGGEAGTAVGRLLARLAGHHQVLCVTHLAQVAAFADAQLVVEKREEDGRTVARVASVGGEARIAELSRMLAGLGESTHARRHASELLDSAGRGGRGGDGR